jgi:splicing factor 3B subunit 5
MVRNFSFPHFLDLLMTLS